MANKKKNSLEQQIAILRTKINHANEWAIRGKIKQIQKKIDAQKYFNFLAK